MTPAKTLAIVIGVERYEVENSWDLNGPVPDACRLVDWLLSRDLPPENITLLTSPLPQNQHLVDQQEQQGIAVADAMSETLRRRLVTQLPEENSELLLVYWGGHGVHDGQTSRRLICADARRSDLRNVNITSLLGFMRSDVYRRHPRQVVIIDSCLTFTSDLRMDQELPNETFSTGTPMAGCDQRTIFAASEGQRAKNLDHLGTGLFSDVVLKQLRLLPDSEWPPRVEAVWDAVKAKFGELTDRGTTRQVPSEIEYTSPTRVDSLAPGGSANARPVDAAALDALLLDEREQVGLTKILRAASLPTGALRSIYRQSTRSFALRPPANPDDVHLVVETLRRPVSALPLFEFLARLAHATEDDVTCDRLWEWIGAVAPRYQVDIDALRALGDRLSRVYVLVRLEPDLIGNGYQVTAWEYVGEDGRQTTTTEAPWSLDQVAQELSHLLGEFDPGDSDKPPIVEFLVPDPMLDDELESLPVHVAGADRAVGLTYPVVVRPLSRLADPEWRAAHKKAWSTLHERGQSYDQQAIRWIDHGIDEHSLTGYPAQGEVCAAVACKECCPHDTEVLRHLLVTGTPIILWHRGTRPARREALERVLRSQPLLDLPEAVLEQRNNSQHPKASGDHAGRDLVLVWDDPTRMPHAPEWQTPLKEGTSA